MTDSLNFAKGVSMRASLLLLALMSTSLARAEDDYDHAWVMRSDGLKLVQRLADANPANAAWAAALKAQILTDPDDGNPQPWSMEAFMLVVEATSQ